MTTPEEATPADVAEQRRTPTGDAPLLPDPDVPLEATDADVLEQAAPTGPDEHLATTGGDAGGVPLEADAYDAVEQASVVELDEDERR